MTIFYTPPTVSALFPPLKMYLSQEHWAGMMKLLPAATPPATQRERKTFLLPDVHFILMPLHHPDVLIKGGGWFHVPTTTHHKLIRSMMECFFLGVFFGPERLRLAVGGEKIGNRIDAPRDKGSKDLFIYFFLLAFKQWGKKGSEVALKGRKKTVRGCVPGLLSIVRHMECVLSILHSITICCD